MMSNSEVLRLNFPPHNIIRSCRFGPRRSIIINAWPLSIPDAYTFGNPSMFLFCLKMAPITLSSLAICEALVASFSTLMAVNLGNLRD